MANVNHPLEATIDSLLAMQEAREFADPIVAAQENYVAARDKVFGVAHAIQQLIRETPPSLVSTQRLNNLNAHLQAPVNELTAFRSNKNPAHLTNAVAHIDQHVIPLLWAFVPTKPGKSPLPNVVKAQAQSALQTIATLEEKRAEAEARLSAQAAKISEFNTRLEALNQSVVKDRAEAAAAVAKLQQEFAENETSRAADFVKAIQAFRDEFVTFETNAKADAANLLLALEGKKNEAARIVQVVGNIGVTGNYQQIANSESRQANFWRWVTLGIFAAGLFVAGATFVKFWGQPFNTENAWAVAIRLLYAIAITAPAWYTAKESARHRTNSDRARQTELELASIGPFIELMPEEKKVEIREQLSKIYFGRPVEAHIASTPLDLGQVKDFVVEVAKAVRK